MRNSVPDPASLTDAYDQLEADAIRHTPGGVLFPADKAGLRLRVANSLCVPVAAVAHALTERDHAARLSRTAAKART